MQAVPMIYTKKDEIKIFFRKFLLREDYSIPLRIFLG